MGSERLSESIDTKLKRELNLAAEGLNGFADAARDAFTNHKTETLLEAGGAAAVGVGLALVRQIPGIGLPISLAMSAGLLGASVKGVVENGSAAFGAFHDNWKSADHWQANKDIVHNDIGKFAFDTAVMAAAGGVSAGLVRGFGAAGFTSARPLGALASGETPLRSGFLSAGPKLDVEPAFPNTEVQRAFQFQRDTSANSPWLRTVANLPFLPRLEGKVDADVAVVGSGVVGQQIAYRLAQMGKKVVVLEGGRVASGTSGMMGAMNTVVPDTGFGPMLEKLGPDKFAEMMGRMLAARSSVEILGRKYGDFRPHNSYNVAYSENNADVVSEADLLRKFDPRVRFVNGKEAQDLFPLARSAAILPGEGNLNPVKMLNGMARSGQYQVFENSPVLSVVPTTDGALVFTDNGVVHAKDKVILATNHPVGPFIDANDHLTAVQTFANVADIGRRMPGNYFDAPDQTSGKVPFSYWRQFNLPKFGSTETLVGGTAHFLHDGVALPFEPQLPQVTSRLFNGASGRDQFTALIWTDYDWGLPLYYHHRQFPVLSTALGGGGNGLNAGAMLAQAVAREAIGQTDPLLTPARSVT